MDSDRFDQALDSSFLVEPNSGRDWAGLGCANEVNWNIDAMTQVYVHTGDPRLRYYLRGMLQRWPELYQATYEDSLSDYTTSDALTEGLGVFDGAGPGRGNRYPYGFSPSLPLNEPIGASAMRVVAGAKAVIAFDKNGTGTDVTDYRTGGNGSCTFRIVSKLAGVFDVGFSYPFVDISALTVTRTRHSQTTTLGANDVARPSQSPSSLYLRNLEDGDVVTVGTVPVIAQPISFDTSLEYDESEVTPRTHGHFTALSLSGDYLLPQDWNDRSSFAGLLPGERWNCGVPYLQGLHAVTNRIGFSAERGSVVLVCYSPSPDETLTVRPLLFSGDGTPMPLSRHPVLAWRAWPIIFNRKVLMDYAVVPESNSLSRVEIDPNGTLLMAATIFNGMSNDWASFQERLDAASAGFVAEETQALAVLALQESYSRLPAGRIALLPMNTAGPGANFAAATGLRAKWDALSESQLIDTNWFNPVRYPVAFYLGNENYVKTVKVTGDAKLAVTKYLAGGGTLVVLATGPFPFYYGYGPADQPGTADPLLPSLGMPFEGFEQAPAGIFMQRHINQSILRSVPDQFPFPPGDERLRAINGNSVSSANRYIPFLKAIDAQGNYYGDAAGFLAFGTGPARGGKVLYVWDTLLAGPQGQQIMTDVVTWVLDAIFRPPAVRFERAELLEGSRAVFQFTAVSNLDYILQSRSSLAAGTWLTQRDFFTAPTNRSIWFTNVLSASAQFYRLLLGP
jgi:hypothetical protein